MKKLFICFVVYTLLFFIPSPSTSFYENGELCVQNGIAIDSIKEVLNTDVGNKMVGLIEDMGGSIGNIDDGTSIVLQNIEAFLIPAGQSNANKLILIYLNLKDKSQFLFIVEGNVNPSDIKNAYIKIYTPSGRTITFNKFKLNFGNAHFSFQEFDDMANSISIQNFFSPDCLALLIFALALPAVLYPIGLIVTVPVSILLITAWMLNLCILPL